MADIEFEPTHFAREAGAQAVCGVALSHPYNVSTEAAWVECEGCLEEMRRRDTLPAGAADVDAEGKVA